MNSIGLLCHCWSALVQFMSAIVATAHDLVRDLIAEALALVVEGMGTGLAVATRALGEVKRLADATKALIDLVNRGGDAAPA